MPDPRRAQPSPLFDGEIETRRVPVQLPEFTPGEPPEKPALFGARSVLLVAILLQIAAAAYFSRRVVRALEYLALHPGNALPLAASGALAAGLLGWAWWFRQMKVAGAFCLCALLWWLIFIGPSV